MSAAAPGLFDGPARRRVARVAVDVPLAHLDRFFDYEVPEALVDVAVPGCRVKVPFSGRIRDGWLVSFGDAEPEMKLLALKSVVSSEPILDDALVELFRAVADHYAGVLTDVIRLAVPRRHSTTEKAVPRDWPDPEEYPSRAVLPLFPGGAGFLDALQQGLGPRAFWQVPCVADPAGDLVGGVLEAVASTVAAGKGAIVIVPTLRELDAALPRFQGAFGTGAVAVLNGELGDSARYRNWLALRRGQARILLATRSGILAPMSDLGLVVVLDDGNDSHAEPRAPHPHSRGMAVLRCLQSGCALLLAAHGRSTDAAALIGRGWLNQLALTPGQTRALTPPVRISGDSAGHRDPTAARLRLPSVAFEFLRTALTQGPVLVQVPRAGHSAGLSCQRCGERALCQKCRGPLRRPSQGRLECAWCGNTPPRWECTFCHHQNLRAPIVGALRTAEELGRAFPGVVAINSSAAMIRTDVPDAAAIVVATPGAEPEAPSGYAGVLLLDTELMLSRADLRVGEESMRRWCNAIALSRGPRDGGRVLAVGPSEHPALQALVRGDVGGFIASELAERVSAGLPPAVKAVRVGGDADAVREFLDNDPFEGVEILGPNEFQHGPTAETVALLRVPLEQGRELVRRVKYAAAIRSARKEGGRLYIQVDPEVIG
ncbi:primosomal protein N' family DNA-binding protein [Tessaracoccus sp.]